MSSSNPQDQSGPGAVASRRALVLHVMDKFTVSGSGVHGVLQLVMYLLPRFDPARYDFKVIGLRKNPPGFDLGTAPDFPIETLNLGKFNPLALFSLLRLIRQDRPAILHLHGYAAWNFGRIAGFLTGIPVVLQEHIAHGSPPLYQSIADRLLSLLPYTAIAVSDTVRRFMRVKRHVRSDKVVVIPNGIPIEAFSSVPPSETDAIRSELKLRRNTRVVGTVGRLDPIKGLDLLLRAVPEVLNKIPEVRVVVVGEGPLAGELRRLTAELGIQDHVTFLGHRKDIPRLLSVMEVFVVPSLSEGFCLAAVEAMAAGKVILSSDCEALTNLFRGGESARLFHSGDWSHLSEQLQRIMTDAALRKELSQRAVENSRRFDIRETALAYAEVYERMLTPA
jgi:glycosyltransferase involved in cell wall biosynthesis